MQNLLEVSVEKLKLELFRLGISNIIQILKQIASYKMKHAERMIKIDRPAFLDLLRKESALYNELRRRKVTNSPKFKALWNHLQVGLSRSSK